MAKISIKTTIRVYKFILVLGLILQSAISYSQQCGQLRVFYCQGEDCSLSIDPDTIEFDNNGYIIQTAEELDYGYIDVWHEYNDYEYNYGLNDYYEFISIEREIKNPWDGTFTFSGDDYVRTCDWKEEEISIKFNYLKNGVPKYQNFHTNLTRGRLMYRMDAISGGGNNTCLGFLGAVNVPDEVHLSYLELVKVEYVLDDATLIFK